MKFDRRRPMERPRPPFGALARAAIEKHVAMSRGEAAEWALGPNAVWVRWPAEARFHYLGINRHLNWVSGEFGVSWAPVPLSDLYSLPGTPPGKVDGYRIRLGHLLEDNDRWWPVGHGESFLIERLEWLALQLRVKGAAYFSRWPAEPAGAER